MNNTNSEFIISETQPGMHPFTCFTAECLNCSRQTVCLFVIAGRMMKRSVAWSDSIAIVRNDC